MGKKKNLFTHLQQITAWKNKNYWDNLTEGEKKEYSPYMINRFLSMDPELIEIVNEVQVYQLTRKQSYDLYMDLLPKEKRYNKYLKGSKENNKKEAEILANHFNVSMREANLYLDIFNRGGDTETVTRIKKLYGELYNE